MSPEEIRVFVYERPPAAMRFARVAPDKPFVAFAMTGPPSKVKVEASAYGASHDQALDALEALVSAPEYVEAKAAAPKRPKYHLAKALDPSAAFHSICTAAGCGKVVFRQFGVQARRSDFRHAKAGEHV